MTLAPVVSRVTRTLSFSIMYSSTPSPSMSVALSVTSPGSAPMPSCVVALIPMASAVAVYAPGARVRLKSRVLLPAFGISQVLVSEYASFPEASVTVTVTGTDAAPVMLWTETGKTQPDAGP